MKILCCTSNQPRHVTLVKRLLAAGHDVLTIVEPKTYGAAKGFERYWDYVREAELDIFGRAHFMPGPVLALRPGELSGVPELAGVYAEDRLPIVFSSSYITTPVVEWFVNAGALNLHVGIAPEYRGSAPNFWALYDKNDELVGAQVQRLGKGLDSGAILAEVKDMDLDRNPFERGMLAAAHGIDVLVGFLEHYRPEASVYPVRANDPALQIRYSRHSDFTPEIANEFLERYGL